jgi:alpha-D-ribose 1-methylphosphonate 5-triphosphate diphosphatase PhnM
LPEIVIECQIEQRAVHIQQHGVDILPGNIDMHGNSPEENMMRDRVAYPVAQACYRIRLSGSSISVGFRQLS